MSPARYREDLLELLRDQFQDQPEVQSGRMFGHPGFKIEGRFFAILDADGIVLKLPPADYQELLDQDETEPFAPGGTAMSTWLTLTYPDGEDYLTHWHWIESARQFTRAEALKQDVKEKTKKAKPTKPSKAPTSGNLLSLETFKFFDDLCENNFKGWFDLNRKRYENFVKNPLKALALSLAEPVKTMLPDFTDAAKVSRINNDLRFQPQKAPYKEHMWISFGVKAAPADLFIGISRQGWSTGCGIGHPQKEPLANWRQNLIRFSDLWRAYIKALEAYRPINYYFSDQYKKPLFTGIPADLEQLIQSKSVWLVLESRREFSTVQEVEIFKGLGLVLPIYYFMTLPPQALEERLLDLGEAISAPDQEVATIWDCVKP